MREVITQRAHGIDISMYQLFRGATKEQDRGFDLERTWGQIDFGIVKIGEGYNTPYKTLQGSKDGDRDFRLLWDGVSKLPIRGVYFYQRSGFSWKQQAENVLQYLDTLEVKPHMVWLDLEKINNVIDKTMIADAKNIMDYWKANISYAKVGLYANPDVINNYVIPLGTRNYGKAYVDAIMSYPQWLAQYWFIKSPDKQPSSYKGYPNWDLWQYSDKGDSFGTGDKKSWRHYGSPDLNVYNGTVAEMKEWLGIKEGTETPTPVETPCPTCGKLWNGVKV